MSLNKIRLITFDVTHTLLKFSLSPGHQYGSVAKEYGVNIDVESMANNFKKQYTEMSICFPNFGKLNNISWEEWWTTVVRNTFKPYVCDELILKSIANDLIESYKSKECWTLNEGCEKILNHLDKHHVALGVISNFDPRLTEILKNVKLYHFFDFILTSYETGYMKPNSNIFNEALRKSNIPDILSSEALHIGDNVELDYFGAKLAGWQAAIITNKPKNSEIYKSEAYKNVDSSCIFSNLCELRQHFDNNKDIFKNYCMSFNIIYSLHIYPFGNMEHSSVIDFFIESYSLVREKNKKMLNIYKSLRNK